MIVLAFAAAALTQWTGPRTVEYVGPGNFCGGGYAFHLAKGERALVLPQDTGGQGVRLVLGGGREVNIHSGARPLPGPVVMHYPGGTAVTQQTDGAGFAYVVADQTSFALAVTSPAFRGFHKDGWFFSKANFSDRADEQVPCLAAYSY
jgi:hypothetical protein